MNQRPVRRLAALGACDSPARAVRGEELDAALERLSATARDIYLHLDLDALDPEEGRANSYAVSGGFSLDQMVAAIRAVRRRFRVRAAAITAFDPAADSSGRACRAGLRLMQTLVEEEET